MPQSFCVFFLREPRQPRGGGRFLGELEHFLCREQGHENANRFQVNAKLRQSISMLEYNYPGGYVVLKSLLRLRIDAALPLLIIDAFFALSALNCSTDLYPFFAPPSDRGVFAPPPLVGGL